ncbi:lysine N(6)-hydroxylase/L-ornithine N(5)-oxygenase family protein [Bacterioplanoides sp.]|uniref:lysine N(6)-hydroxylase/L-ornithine N(5)-oxygenase family protein n=2 Tax=Bacterioplanoides sp. TaxID=2066072 RepID=UPI003AFFE7C5
MMNNDSVFDFIAIGVGPFNLGLACLTDTLADVNGVFLEQRSGFDWHPGMMLESAHLQTPFMSDLVTLADPTHPLSFLNYIKQQGRLYSFYIREDFFLMRSEYNQYCQWATQQVSNIRFNTRVERVEYQESTSLYEIQTRATESGQTQTLYTRKLVLGTGPSPHKPEFCQDLKGMNVHSADYLFNKAALQQKKSITIVGSGQSAAEIYYDLLQGIDQYGYELNWITRSPRFFPLEYSKLTLEMTSPEYVDYFYGLPAEKRDQLVSHQKHLYKGINASLINDIYDLLYVKRLAADFNTNLLTNSTLLSAEDTQDNSIRLFFRQDEQQQDYALETDALVLSTGYMYQLPDFLEPISSRIEWDGKGRFSVKRNYSVDRNGAEIFVQNAELHTHGFVTPDLGMACYRNSYILREITGVEYYPIEERIAFQQFPAPANQSQMQNLSKVQSTGKTMKLTPVIREKSANEMAVGDES